MDSDPFSGTDPKPYFSVPVNLKPNPQLFTKTSFDIAPQKVFCQKSSQALQFQFAVKKTLLKNKSTDVLVYVKLFFLLLSLNFFMCSLI